MGGATSVLLFNASSACTPRVDSEYAGALVAGIEGFASGFEPFMITR